MSSFTMLYSRFTFIQYLYDYPSDYEVLQYYTPIIKLYIRICAIYNPLLTYCIYNINDCCKNGKFLSPKECNGVTTQSNWCRSQKSWLHHCNDVFALSTPSNNNTKKTTMFCNKKKKKKKIRDWESRSPRSETFSLRVPKTWSKKEGAVFLLVIRPRIDSNKIDSCNSWLL